MRLFCSFFLVVEALVTAGLWVLLLLDPARAAWFLPGSVPPELMRTFLVGDVALFVVAPLAAGHAVFHRLRWAREALWFHAGGVVYAALWLAYQVAMTGAGVVGLVLLLPPLVLVPWFAWRQPRGAGEDGARGSS